MLRDLPLIRNQSLKSADDQYARISKLKLKVKMLQKKLSQPTRWDPVT